MGSADASAYDGCEAVGAWTAPFLAEHPEAETRVDAALQAELGLLAVAKAREWTDRQAAAALLHLAIDAFIYLCLGPARRNPQVRAIQKGLMDMGGG